MAENHKHYDNGEITVHWKPGGFAGAPPNA